MDNPNKDKIWTEGPEQIRIIVPHDIGGVEAVFSKAFKIRVFKGTREKLIFIEKRDENGEDI